MTMQTSLAGPYDPNSTLPFHKISGMDGRVRLGVHVSGTLDDRRLPLICIADYCRNMFDFEEFLAHFHRNSEADWPVILIDLAGHGRSDHHTRINRYSTVNDARDVGAVLGALGIEKAMFLGQGHGGQVIMSLGAQQCHLIAGTVLIDTSPTVHAPGLVRLRDNFQMLLGLRKRKQYLGASRQIFGRSHPGADVETLDRIRDRTFLWTKPGRVIAKFDPKLLKRLEDIQSEDIFEPQWPMFNMLAHAPMLLMRTQLTDILERKTFDLMGNRRSDSVQFVIPGQGSPALLNGDDEVGTIADFMAYANKQSRLVPVLCG